MPRLRAVAVAAGMAVMVVACDGSERTAPPATTAAPPPTSTTAAPSTVAPTAAPASPAPGEIALHTHGLRLAQAGDALRVIVHSDAPRLTVTVRSAAVPPLRVCPVAGLDAAAPAGSCLTAAAGTPVSVPLALSYTGVEVARTGGGGPADIDQVTVAYRPRDRGMEIRLPEMAPGAPSAGTLFRLTPPAAGEFRATAQWSGPGGQPSRGELTVEEGPAASRRLVAKAEGAPGGRVTATPTSAVDLWLTMRASGDATLVAPTITVTWPG